MDKAALSPLAEWENFYVIVGSSAGALTGLQFVVMALIVDLEAPARTGEVAAFGSPTIVHFCSVLFVSGALSAPWHALSGAAVTLGICGAIGIGYVLLIAWRARRTTYQPV